MRTYSVKKLMDLRGICSRQRVPISPFPGKIPLRLFVAVFLCQDTGKRLTRYRYHGKFNWSAMVTASRIYENLKENGQTAQSVVYEYHRNGLISSGNLVEATSFHGHNWFHLASRNIQERNHTPLDFRDHNGEAWFRVDNKSILVPKEIIPLATDVAATNALKTRIRRHWRAMELR